MVLALQKEHDTASKILYQEYYQSSPLVFYLIVTGGDKTHLHITAPLPLYIVSFKTSKNSRNKVRSVS